MREPVLKLIDFALNDLKILECTRLDARTEAGGDPVALVEPPAEAPQSPAPAPAAPAEHKHTFNENGDCTGLGCSAHRSN